MKNGTCPECGSNEIIPDLVVFCDEENTGIKLLNVRLVESEPANRPFIWMPKSVKIAFRASICGSCGYTRIYTKYHADLLEAHKKGWKSQAYVAGIVPPP